MKFIFTISIFAYLILFKQPMYAQNVFDTMQNQIDVKQDSLTLNSNEEEIEAGDEEGPVDHPAHRPIPRAECGRSGR